MQRDLQHGKSLHNDLNLSSHVHQEWRDKTAAGKQANIADTFRHAKET